MNKKLISGLVFAGGLLCGCTDHVTELDEAYELSGVKIKDFVFKDSRDGNRYSVAVIGGNVWMAENLRYADSSKSKNLKGSTWCYENDEENCEKYGRLYSWTAALMVDSSFQYKDKIYANEQGICPNGWRLPTEADWNALVKYVDLRNGVESIGASLKSKSGWKKSDSVAVGVNRFGFNALAAGRRNNDGEDFMETEKFAFFWSINEVDAGTAVGWTLRYDNDFLDHGEYYKGHGMSVRCITDTSKVTFDTTKAFVEAEVPPIDYGYGSVKYDGKTYNTVEIDGLVWFAENLAADKGDNWCYKDNADSCAKYGRLYNWKTAMEICPEGWRLPTSEDFYALFNYAGGAYALQTEKDWSKEKGGDYYGFSARPAGGFDGDGFYDLHQSAYFWSSREEDESTAYSLFLTFYSNSGTGHKDKKSKGLSVRCVKDAQSEDTETTEESAK